MHITAVKVYRDTKNFFQYQLFNILLIAMLCSLITILINYFFSPNINQLFVFNEGDTLDYTSIFDRIQKMNLEQHKVILKIAFVGTFSFLIGHVMLISSTILLIMIVSSKNYINLSNVIKFFSIITPKLLLLVFFIMLTVQTGFMILLFPGIICIIIFSLSPIILIIEQISVVKSIENSIKLVFTNIKLVFPAVALWFILKLILIIIIAFLYNILPIDLLTIIFNTINYLILSILIIYLTRLYAFLN